MCHRPGAIQTAAIQSDTTGGRVIALRRSARNADVPGHVPRDAYAKAVLHDAWSDRGTAHRLDLIEVDVAEPIREFIGGLRQGGLDRLAGESEVAAARHAFASAGRASVLGVGQR
jgi:hypothetical protein